MLSCLAATILPTRQINDFLKILQISMTFAPANFIIVD